MRVCLHESLCMIGHPINWKELAFLYGYCATHMLMRGLRKDKGWTYRRISRELGVSESALYNKCMDLVDKGRLTLDDLKRNRNA